MVTRPVKLISNVGAVLFVALLAGCSSQTGPQLAEVRGTVTLDGQPLPDATVMFIPENGRMSIGVTDAKGEYRLQYTAGRSGTMPGKNKVRISTGRSAEEDDDGNRVPAVPEKVPEEYNQKTTLEFEVKGDEKNTADFDLKSGGRIIQPD